MAPSGFCALSGFRGAGATLSGDFFAVRHRPAAAGGPASPAPTPAVVLPASPFRGPALGSRRHDGPGPDRGGGEIALRSRAR